MLKTVYQLWKVWVQKLLNCVDIVHKHTALPHSFVNQKNLYALSTQTIRNLINSNYWISIDVRGVLFTVSTTPIKTTTLYIKGEK
jgi:hypothetical protein